MQYAICNMQYAYFPHNIGKVNKDKDNKDKGNMDNANVVKGTFSP